MLQGNKNMLAITVLRLAWFKTGLNFMTLYPRVAEAVRFSADAKIGKKFRQARIYYICDKCVIFAHNCKLTNLIQCKMQDISCNSALHEQKYCC